MGTTDREKGGALLAVLWLSAGLGAIAFSVASTVRGETDRTSTALDQTRAYYLAAGAVERAILHVLWGPQFPQFYKPSRPVLRLSFPSGEAEVEVIPENSRFNINNAVPEELFRLLGHLGADPDRARAIVEGILDWRTGAGAPTAMDQFYLNQVPSFRARHASLEETEELLLVHGMTPELFYGTYDRDPEGRLIPRGGLRDCVSVFGSTERFDANTAHPAVLLTLGLTPASVAALVERRRVMPFQNEGDLRGFLQGAGPGAGRLRIGGNSIFTLRATATIRLENDSLSDVRRSVAAMVKFLPQEFTDRYHILRWYDEAWRD